MMICPKCGKTNEDGAAFCGGCGASLSANPWNVQPVAPVQQTLGMKWFNFLIYFALFAGAVINLVNGFKLVTGSAYGEYTSFVYAMLDGLQVLDIIVGLAAIAFAALQVFVRFRLAGYYVNGPKLLNLSYILVASINLVYLFGLIIILPDSISGSIDYTSTIANIAVSVIMVSVNTTYFKKRSHLFTKA